MQAFLCEQNIANFVRQLEVEPDTAKRATLQSLLLEEEDRFGRTAEKLDRADHLIAEGGARIDRQKSLIKDLKSRGCAFRDAEKLLDNLEDIQALIQSYRLHLMKRLDESAPA